MSGTLYCTETDSYDPGGQLKQLIDHSRLIHYSGSLCTTCIIYVMHVIPHFIEIEIFLELEWDQVEKSDFLI